MPTLKKQRYSNTFIKQVSEVVRKLPEAQSCSGNPREFLDALVKRCGGRIVIAEDESNWESLRISADGTFTIYLPPETSPLRDNFTIAHELGHYLLHTDRTGVGALVFNRFGSDRGETEANCFAANLLMPEGQFREKAAEFGNDEYRLAGYFGVSVAATRVRKNVLALA